MLRGKRDRELGSVSLSQRVPNRYVDESRYNDPDYSPGSFEVADHGSIEVTHAEQPTTQSRSQCRRSKDHTLIDTKEWIDLTANVCCHKYQLETGISEFVMRLVRHMDLQERESDEAVHWKSMGPKGWCAFLKDGGDTLSYTDWDNHMLKGSNYFQFIRAIQGDTGGDDHAWTDGSCRYSFTNRKEFLFHTQSSMRDKKQTSVSHSFTESEVISLDADLRVDGLLVLHSRDVVIEV